MFNREGSWFVMTR